MFGSLLREDLDCCDGYLVDIVQVRQCQGTGWWQRQVHAHSSFCLFYSTLHVRDSAPSHG